MSNAVGTLMQRAARARRENRLADAHRDSAEAVALCRGAGEPTELVQALKGLGQIERDLGRGDSARASYEEAVAICRGDGDAISLAHTLRHLGDIHREAGDLELAEPCYREALALYRADDRTQPLDLANAVRPLAIVKERTGQKDEARRLWKEARDLYAVAEVPAGVLESLERLSALRRG